MRLTSQESNPLTSSFRGQLKPIVGVKQLRQENLYENSTIPYQEDRLRLEATLTKGWFYAEVADETLYRIERKNAAFLPFAFTESEPFWNAEWKIEERDNSLLKTRLDRAYIQASFEPVEIRIGKQVIPIGVGHLFSTVSQTRRYAFTDVDPEYDRTEDAVTVLWKKGVRLDARYLPRDKGKERDNFHLRWLFDFEGADAVLGAGQTDGKHFVSLEGSRGVGDAVLRFEAILYENADRYQGQSLLGWDEVWNSKVSTKTEIFYNGFGKDQTTTLEGFPHRSSNYRGKFYFGNLIQYEWTPRLKVNFLTIANLNDPSLLLHLYFNYSLSDNLDLILGHYQNWGGTPSSEFGGKMDVPFTLAKVGLPDLSYALVRWAF